MSSVVSHQILQQLGVIGLYADLIRHAADGDAARPLARTREGERAPRSRGRSATSTACSRDLLVFSRDLRV